MQRANLLTGIATIVTAVVLGGCYPSYLTSRPEAEIIVTDESCAPLQGATVTLGTVEWHGIVGQTTLTKFVTDAEGKVAVDNQHAWATQYTVLDGGTYYTWSLCFSKPGFEAIPMMSMKFGEPIRIAMYPSAVASECEWDQRVFVPNVKERDERWIEVAGGEWQTHRGFAMTMDEKIRSAMDASAREQGIKLRSWSEYRFQYQARGNGMQDTRLFIHAFCRAPADFDLEESFYSELDDRACYFDTTYTSRVYIGQPESSFSPLEIASGSG